jgi:glycosyltransferase involved in cell wall biosynthesis
MRALFLLGDLSVGGSETKSVRIVNELVTRGKSIHLAYMNEPAILLPKVDKRIPTACLHRKGKFSFTALRNLRDFIAKHEISVVVCMNLYPFLYAACLKLFFSHRSLKVILAINTTEFERKRDRWFMLIYGPLIRRTDAVVYGCQFQMKLWQRKYQLSRVRSDVIYNGVDSVLFDPASSPGDLRKTLGVEDSFVIGSVGRLDPEKNQSVLLKVAARLSSDSQPIDVLLVGTGPERGNLEKLSLDLGIRERVHFLERMDDVRSALATFDVFVLPSKSVETFSNAALEAMSMSLPVILSDIAGASEMISDGDDGFLYDKSDTAKLESLLDRVRNDAELRRRIGQRAGIRARSQFNIERMFSDYENLLG